MEKGQLCESLVKWIQTFHVKAPHWSVEELSDGLAMAQVLSQIDPVYFDSIWLTKINADARTNWRLKVSNLKKVLQGILDYYQECLGQRIAGFQMPDVNKIGEHGDANELGRLLQLILGCAVNCDNKQAYITAIMELEESLQHVVMNAIQELMRKELPSIPGSENLTEMAEQISRLRDDLQAAIDAREHITQRCLELDNQVSTLQEERANLQLENEMLTERLNQGEGLDDISTAAGRKYQQLQHQLDQLQEEMYKLETARDEYRVKVEDLEKDFLELQQKNDELQRVAEEARHLKDEIDVLRETSDKVAKYEATVETYKKKLEDLSDLRRQVKLLEDKNTSYMQQNMELEEEIKKSIALKTQVEMYKKQVQELHAKLSEETKKADKAEFECNKLQEKLLALQREKDKLIAERDTLRETNEELRCAQFHTDFTQSSSEKIGRPPSLNSESDMLEMIPLPPEIKEKLIRLQHENKLLKLEKQGSDDQQTQVLKAMLDDARARQVELDTENRLANQRILELESQLEDLQSSQTAVSNKGESDLRQKLNEALSRVKDLEMDVHRKNTHIDELDSLHAANAHKMQLLQDALNRKEDEMQAMEERYKKHLDKAKSVIKILDPKQNPTAAPEISALRNQMQEKDRLIESLERETEKSKALREMEERLMTTAFYNLGVQLQQRVAEDRLTNMTIGRSFLARQRQASSRRLPVGNSEFMDY